jgi:serine phosphatase RsbU (regulator of sigma subunit)
MWVFASVIIIEGIILIPSLHNRKLELLDQLRQKSAAQVALILQLCGPDASDVDILTQLQTLMFHPVVIGGRLYRQDGTAVGHFGKFPEQPMPVANSSEITGAYTHDGRKYDVIWPSAQFKDNLTLVMRHDTAAVDRELKAFIWRIIGLVVIISIVVTGGAWIALHPLVIKPILRLRRDLITAGEAISNDHATPTFTVAAIQRGDELGEVIKAFHHMYRQITDAILKRKQAEASLQNTLQQVEAYSQVLDKELEKGRQIQTNFLPAELPSIDGWETKAYFRPARQVAGDFYDLFQLPGGRFGLVISDVCDKGVGAALFMALIRSLIRIFSGQATVECMAPNDSVELIASSGRQQLPADCKDPQTYQALKAIGLTNDYIALNHDELAMFATLFFGVLDPRDGSLCYISAGHEPLYIIDANGQIEAELSATGPALGLQPNITFKVSACRLAPGDLLLGYTDGVTEATAPDGEFFNTHRLRDLLTANGGSASALVDRIAEAVLAHIASAEQFDDITLLALRRHIHVSGPPSA